MYCTGSGEVKQSIIILEATTTEEMELDLGVSTVGKRRDQSDADCPIEVTTAKVLQRLEIDSPFFEQNPPRPLPSFSPEGMFPLPTK